MEALSKLDIFPPGLDSLYERMMQQISTSDSADVCKQILASIAIVYRPITLQELTSLIGMLGDMADDLDSLREVIGLCGSFLAIRGDTVYLVHQSVKEFIFTKAFDEIFPSGTEKAHHIVFSRSLQIMSKALRRDMYDLRAPGYHAEQVQVPDPDPLAYSRYSCVYWINHLEDSNPKSSVNSMANLLDDGVVHDFIRTKFLYWLEALSLCKSMPQGVISMRRLETLVRVIPGFGPISMYVFTLIYPRQEQIPPNYSS